jgi:hypothetical protein
VRLDELRIVNVKAHIPRRLSPREVLALNSIRSISRSGQDNRTVMRLAAVFDLRIRVVGVDVN